MGAYADAVVGAGAVPYGDPGLVYYRVPARISRSDNSVAVPHYRRNRCIDDRVVVADTEARGLHRGLRKSPTMKRPRQFWCPDEDKAAYNEADGVMGRSEGAHSEISISGNTTEMMTASNIPFTKRTQKGASVANAHPMPSNTKIAAAIQTAIRAPLVPHPGKRDIAIPMETIATDGA
jgi:hypothetical protein